VDRYEKLKTCVSDKLAAVAAADGGGGGGGGALVHETRKFLENLLDKAINKKEIDKNKKKVFLEIFDSPDPISDDKASLLKELAKVVNERLKTIDQAKYKKLIDDLKAAIKKKIDSVGKKKTSFALPKPPSPGAPGSALAPVELKHEMQEILELSKSSNINDITKGNDKIRNIPSDKIKQSPTMMRTLHEIMSQLKKKKGIENKNLEKACADFFGLCHAKMDKIKTDVNKVGIKILTW
jgi:hypothetical protein